VSETQRRSDATGDRGSSTLLRSDWVHLDAVLHALVERLSEVPGLRMRVTYRHGTLRRVTGDIPFVNDLHRTSDPIRSIVVTVASSRYWVDVTEGSMQCGAESSTPPAGAGREIATFHDWADALFTDIARRNHLDPEMMAALRDLIEHDRG
jgi:hypothetical protein